MVLTLKNLILFFFFIILHYKIFYLFKAYKIKNYLSLVAIAILLYSNHAVIYTVFNYYQLVDLITYIVIIYFIELHNGDVKIESEENIGTKVTILLPKNRL